MLQLARSPFLNTAVALLISVAAAVVTWLLLPYLRASPTLLLTAAVFLSAWSGGMGAGLLATCLCAVGGYLLLGLPFSSVGLFVLVGGLISSLNTALRTAHGRAQTAAHARDTSLQALRESEARKSAILEAALDAIITIDHEGKILEFNPAAETMFGYARSEAIGREMAELILPPSMRDRHRQGLARYLATGNGAVLGKRIEMPALRADGTEFSVELAISRIPTEGAPMFTGYLRDITERRRHEQEQQAVMASARCLLWYANVCDSGRDDLHWDFRPVNEEAAQSFLPLSIPPDKSYAIAWSESRLLEDKARMDAYAKQAVREGRSYTQEFRCRNAHGEVRWLREDVRIEPDGPQRWRAVGVTTDITERKQAEQALRESETLYRTLGEAVPDFVWAHGPGDSWYVNQRWREYTGLTQDPPEWLPTDVLHHPDDYPRLVEIWSAARDKGEPYEAEFRFRRHDGVYRWFMARAVPVKDEDGQIVQWIGTTTDIHERKQAEEALSRLAAIVEFSDDAITGKTVDGMIMSWNAAAERLYGYSAEEVIGRRISLLVAPDRPDEVPQILERIQRGEGVDHFETVRVRKDGTLVDVSLTFSPIRDAAGAITGISTIARDITARKRDEAEIQRLNETLERRVVERTAQLEEANKELEAFSYSVSHDLRAPLRHLSGFAEMLEKRSAALLDETGLRYLQTIRQSARHAGVLVDDLLAFSRMGRTDMRCARVNIQELVEQVRRDVEPEGEGRTICWGIGALPEVSGDPAMLRLVLRNLMSNAIKYTRPRSEAEVGIGCEEQAGETVFWVRDNGVGFDMQYVDKLFGVFQRLHSTDQFEGTGIGLANVRRIIQRHGGRTWAEGTVDGGATFYFSLPKLEEGDDCRREADPPGGGQCERHRAYAGRSG
jgi:PAS domain S-box-containing protein